MYTRTPIQSVEHFPTLQLNADYIKSRGVVININAVEVTDFGFRTNVLSDCNFCITVEPSQRLTPTLKKRIEQLNSKLNSWRQHIAKVYDETHQDREGFIELIKAWAQHSPDTAPAPLLNLTADIVIGDRFLFFFHE